MYKVFFKDSCFLLTDDPDFTRKNKNIFIHQDFNSTKSFIHQLLDMNKDFTSVIYHDDLEELFSVFKSCFIYVKAAGGAVISNHQLLIISRLGKADLPKGHLEACETIEECAIREVEEECGIKNVHILSPLKPTLHIYFRNENWHLKKTYWYAMDCPPQQTLIPQTEEDIEDVYWLSTDKLNQIYTSTYPSLLPVFHEVADKFMTTAAISG